MATNNIEIEPTQLSELNILFGQLLLFPKSEVIKSSIKKKIFSSNFDENLYKKMLAFNDSETESMLCSYLSTHLGKLNELEERDWVSALIQAEQFEVCLWIINFCKKLSNNENLYFMFYCLYELEFYDDIITLSKKHSLVKTGVTEENVHSIYILALSYEKTKRIEKSKVLFEEINKNFPNYQSIFSKLSTTVLSIPR